LNIKTHISLFILGICLVPQFLTAQVDFNKTPDDDLGNVEDMFQEYFFEALKQKGIENYDRAIKALLKCVELDNTKAVVYFELGKNYVKLKNFGAAEEALKKAISKQPENEWFLDELYGVYYQINDYDKALKTVKQLVKFHPDYKEDLVSLYIRNKKYKAALRVLDELDSQLGSSKSRNAMRNQIYNATGDDKDRIENLKDRIANNPYNESNYLNLIYRYSEQGKKDKAYETAKRLLKQKPNSHLVHLALYKFYLDDNKAQEAIASMKKVLTSVKIKPDAKAKVLNDFVAFVKLNPEYEADLLEVTTLVSGENNGKSHAELGQYYLQKGDKINALKQYQLAFEKEGNDFSIIKNLILLQIDDKQYEKVITLAKTVLEIYPSQPIIYLANGVAFNHLNRPKDAIDTLEMGVDYVIDNKQMEADFYKQLSTAYKMTNNIAKSKAFAKKAEQVLNKQ
jgi:tetratricopeptide (TPR) repeat protein